MKQSQASTPSWLETSHGITERVCAVWADNIERFSRDFDSGPYEKSKSQQEASLSQQIPYFCARHDKPLCAIIM